MKVLYWTPRILALGFLLFISLFAFDAFSEAGSFWEGLIGFLIHLIPTYILIVLLVIAWRWPFIGGIAHFVVGIIFILWFNIKVATFWIIAAPLFIIGLLFLLGKSLKPQKQHS